MPRALAVCRTSVVNSPDDVGVGGERRAHPHHHDPHWLIYRARTDRGKDQREGPYRDGLRPVPGRRVPAAQWSRRLGVGQPEVRHGALWNRVRVRGLHRCVVTAAW
jgi:hypothetical protein